jgi:hypothetical protein
VLRAARLVSAEKKGLYVEYRLADDEVCRFFLALRGLAEARLAEVAQVTRAYFEERGAMEAVDGDELLRRVKGGEVTVLDVRPAEEYRAGHIPGALSIPLGELGTRLKELPTDREVIAYCRGPYCVMAVEAARCGLRPQPFYLGVAFVALGLLLSAFAVRETKHHVSAESRLRGDLQPAGMPTQREVFWRTSILDRDLSSISQAGLVNNLNDGMAWGLFPLFFAAAHMDLGQIGALAAIYPATWGMAQLFTGAWSDSAGRNWLIAWGMWIQAIGIGAVVLSSGFSGFALGAALLGIGTAMVYPTLLAAIGDVAHPSWRTSSVGVYRLWRDLGYAIGALLAGVTADALGLPAAMWLVAALTFASGVIVAVRMTETLHRAAASAQPR